MNIHHFSWAPDVVNNTILHVWFIALGITGEILEDYNNVKELLSLAKGDIVTIVYSDESKHSVFVRTKDLHFGYVPAKIIDVSKDLLQSVRAVAPVEDIKPVEIIVRRQLNVLHSTKPGTHMHRYTTFTGLYI